MCVSGGDTELPKAKQQKSSCATPRLRANRKSRAKGKWEPIPKRRGWGALVLADLLASTVLTMPADCSVLNTSCPHAHALMASWGLSHRQASQQSHRSVQRDVRQDSHRLRCKHRLCHHRTISFSPPSLRSRRLCLRITDPFQLWASVSRQVCLLQPLPSWTLNRRCGNTR